MDLVTGAMGSLGPKLLQLLQDEYKLQSGVRDQVNFLSEELESIRAALRKVAQVPWDQLDEQVKIWARKVRESSYDMEDALDTFLVRVDGREPRDQSKLKRAMKKMANLFSKGKARRDIAGTIEDIKKQLQEVTERRDRYKVDEKLKGPVPTTSNIDPRLDAIYKKVTELVGIDKAMGEIISMLKITKMVSIVGVGGLGKTTLSKASYDKLEMEYDCAAFVSVGRSPDFAKVFKDILFDLDKREYVDIHNTRRGVNLLIRELREFLNLDNKRYLIVIDDVWETSTWKWIKTALVDSNCGSRVIITTRILDVANEVGGIYNMEPLSEDNSKELFYTRIGKEPAHDQHGAEATKKILKKCGGIPLAIITIASLLVDKPVAGWYMVYDSIGFGPEGKNEVVDNTRKILLFSYYDLPPYLKTCLLYLSIYPEDQWMEKDVLIWKWVGEGFVHEEDGKALFEVAETYFIELMNKSMIQPTLHNYFVNGCRVHDMVLDLVCMLATEENFVKKLDRVQQVEHNLSQSSTAVRRLALHGGSNQGESSNLQAANMVHVRSINAFSCPSIISMVPPLSSFLVLRVLSLEGCDLRGGCQLKHLGKLLQLRYLGLRGALVDELPREIRNLVHLQSLDLESTIGLKELPETVSELSNLMRLSLDSHTDVLPWVGKLTSLQILVGGLYRSSLIAELGKLTELRILHIDFLKLDEGDVTALEESLHCLHKIQELSIFNRLGSILMRGLDEWEPPLQLRMLRLANMPLHRLPALLNSKRVPHLSLLDLKLKAMEAQDMDILASMPELRDLQLYLNMGRSLSWTFTGGSLFSNLRNMRLRNIVVKNLHLLKDDVQLDFEYDYDDEEEDFENDYDDEEEETSARDQEPQQQEEEVLAAGEDASGSHRVDPDTNPINPSRKVLGRSNPIRTLGNGFWVDLEKTPFLSQCEAVDNMKSEVAKLTEKGMITEKGGLLHAEAVGNLVYLMQLDRTKKKKKIDFAGRVMVANIIAATESPDCLVRFMQFRGLRVLDDWLQEAHKGKSGEGSSPKEDFLFALLRGLAKLPINLNALQRCSIGKSVNGLRSHKNLEIQKKSRCLVLNWKKRVDAEMKSMI